jgi:hypothetical protein
MTSMDKPPKPTFTLTQPPTFNSNKNEYERYLTNVSQWIALTTVEAPKQALIMIGAIHGRAENAGASLGMEELMDDTEIEARNAKRLGCKSKHPRGWSL